MLWQQVLALILAVMRRDPIATTLSWTAAVVAFPASYAVFVLSTALYGVAYALMLACGITWAEEQLTLPSPLQQAQNDDDDDDDNSNKEEGEEGEEEEEEEEEAMDDRGDGDSGVEVEVQQRKKGRTLVHVLGTYDPVTLAVFWLTFSCVMAGAVYPLWLAAVVCAGLFVPPCAARDADAPWLLAESSHALFSFLSRADPLTRTLYMAASFVHVTVRVTAGVALILAAIAAPFGIFYLIVIGIVDLAT